MERIQWPARRLAIHGIHFHVGVRSGEKAVAIANSLAFHLPLFLALSASSPFWHGLDTGMASARTKIFEGLPTAGLPPQLDSYGDFETFMETLIAAERDRVGARGVVGRAAAPGLRHGRAAHVRRAWRA